MGRKAIPETLTIANLREAYAQGVIAPREVAEAIVQRVEDTAAYNAWITPPSAELLEPYLSKLESMTADERTEKPLWGVPFAVKDNIDVAGMTTTAGCAAFAYAAESSATVVAKLEAAGAFPVGKTNLDQFATGLVGTRSPYGECENALDPAFISGGSSSGSAVAVALGMAAFALGTDTAGSGRVPAALNGIVGFKPPLGSWSTAGVVPACASLDCVSVFAHTLSDCETIDSIVRGVDSSCAWSREVSLGKSELPQTVYVPKTEPRFFGELAEEYRSAWRKSLAALEKLTANASIEMKTLDTQWLSDIASILYDGAWVAERWSDLGQFVSAHASEVFPVTLEILKSGNRPDLSAADAFSAYHEVFTARAKARSLFSNAVLALPTAAGTFLREEVRANPIATNSLMGLYTNHCNLCDLVAVALPAGEATPSHPFGITLFSTATSQGTLLAAARAFLEEQQPDFS